MAGDYSGDAIRPTLPGAYSRYIAQRPATPPPSPGATIALPIPHDWGPMDTPVLLGSYGEFQEDFGISNVVSDTDGARAVQDVFTGEGLEGLGGAGGALVVRIGGSSAAKSSVTLDNPAAADALKVEARYEGTLGDKLKIVTSPIVDDVQTVSVYQGTTLLESFTYTIDAAPALATLRDTINAISKVVRIPTDATGVIVEGVTGLASGTFPLTGGNDGATLTAGDWSAAWDSFANDDFAYIAPFNIPWAQGTTEPAPTNRSIITSLSTWIDDENARGHRISGMVGGALDEAVADGVARAQALASEFIVTIAGPGVDDDNWGARSTAQLVPRVAGIYANRGETQAAHFARLAGTTPRPKPGGGAISLADAETLTNAGAVAIMRDRYRLAPTRLVKSVNTYTLDTDTKPRDVWSNPKYVLSMQQFANEAEADAERFLIGRVVVNQATRNAAAARVLSIARRREPLAFSPGTIVEALPGEDTDEFVKLKVTLVFGRALAQLFIEAHVS